MSDQSKVISTDEALKTLTRYSILEMVGEKLEQYSARDLVTALHWTSKADLKQCLEPDDNLDEYWDNLVNADRALQQFFAQDLVKIIELNRKLKQHER